MPALDLTIEPDVTVRKRGRGFKGELGELNKEYREALRKSKVEGKPVKADKKVKGKKSSKDAREPTSKVAVESRKTVDPEPKDVAEKPEEQMTDQEWYLCSSFK